MSNQIKKIMTIITILVFYVLLLNQLIIINGSGACLPVEKGVVDLTDYDLNRTYQLQGEWQYIKSTETENVESIYKSYNLRIISDKEQRLGVMLSDLSPAYSLWINGQLVSSNGIMGEDSGVFKSDYKHEIVEIDESFYVKHENIYELDILLKTIDAGKIRPNFKRFLIGDLSALEKSNSIMIGLNLFAIGVFLTLLFFSISLYLGGKKENYLLYFGLINLVSLIKSLLNPHPVLVTFFLDIGYFFMKQVDVSIGIINTLLLFVLYWKLYPRLFSSTIYKNLIVVTLSMFAAVIILKYDLAYIIGAIYFLTVFFVSVLLCLYMNIRIVWQDNKGAYILLLGLFLYITSAVFSILTKLHILPYGIINVYVNLAQYGSLVFVLLFSVVIAMKYANSFEEADKLSLELGYINKNLEKIVSEKTMELKNVNDKLSSAYKSIINSQKEKRTLLLNVSHDLRTPLTVIMGYVKSLQDGLAEDEITKNEFLERISRKTRYLNKLINDMFLLGRLEDNKVMLYKTKTDINAFLKQLAESMKIKTEEKEITLSVKLDENIDYKVDIDQHRMNQVIINLLNNAINYTARGGQIEVGTEKMYDEQVLIFFRDNGSGIDIKDIPNIFNRYYKDKKKENDDEATGLGLCIAKEIVEKHHGRIWVESTLGEGSIFYILL